MNTSSFRAPHDSLIIPGIHNGIRIATAWIKTSSLVAGAIGFLMVDLVTGPWFLNGSNPDGSTGYTAAFWGLSLALSATQLFLWNQARKIFRMRTFSKWWSFFPVLIAIGFMVFDTLYDIGWVTSWVYPEASSYTIFVDGPWDDQKFFWLIGVLSVGGVSLFSELILLWMFGQMKHEVGSSTNHPFDGDIEPDKVDSVGRIAGDPFYGG